ncbi:MAG: hypothetical protein F6K56_07705 [Moorea sp. SIO3G5]|nr:hypothetical protein [Moorena sp. SIO3G5]
MFQATSRYYNPETATFTSSDNRVISYKRRRFLPQGESADAFRSHGYRRRSLRSDLRDRILLIEVINNYSDVVL